MVGWHHRLNGHEFEQPLGAGDGQGSLACCRPQSHKESDTTQRLNNNGGKLLNFLSFFPTLFSSVVATFLTFFLTLS